MKERNESGLKMDCVKTILETKGFIKSNLTVSIGGE